jgi:hypothetical protein
MDRRILSRRELAEVGRALGLDFVAGGEVAGFERIERIRRSDTREARTRGRGGVDTTYTWRRVEIEIGLTVEYRLVDAYSRQIVFEETIEVDDRELFERAEYIGDWTALDLTGSERRLFDPEEHNDQERALERRVADAAAVRILERVNRTVLDRIDG